LNSIAVFDDVKHCFRELDTTNYNDDIVIGTIFFRRDAINIINSYYRIIGYLICAENGVHYPIDIRKNDIAIFEGTYNCLFEELKKELIPFNIQHEPQMIWSPFFVRWQFMCDWNVFEESGSFIQLASEIVGNEKLMRKLMAEKIDYVFPSNYKELSKMVCGLNKLYGIDFYNKDYFEEVNYLFDSLINGYHINMTAEEVDTFCYQLCDYVLKNVEGEYV
jgi:hypothetical protein